MKRNKWLVVVAGFVLFCGILLSAQTANKESEEKRLGRHLSFDVDGLDALEALKYLDLHLEGLKALEHLDVHLEGLTQLEELEHLAEVLFSQLDGLEDMKNLDVLSNLDVLDILEDVDFEFNFNWEDLGLDLNDLDFDFDFDFDWECGTSVKNIKQKKETEIK